MDGNESRTSESDLNTSHLKNLWSQIISNIKGWGAQELWETLDSKHFVELLAKVTSLCRDSVATLRYESQLLVLISSIGISFRVH